MSRMIAILCTYMGAFTPTCGDFPDAASKGHKEDGSEKEKIREERKEEVRKKQYAAYMGRLYPRWRPLRRRQRSSFSSR